ncbi:MAG: PDDEXK nuclease domain-containing protein [Brumimicrobium sp.]
MKDLNNLAEIITETHEVFQHAAVRSVNKFLTIRNWMIGYYIVEYEQNGEDRAKYGANVIKNLSKQINKRGLGFTNLKLSRQFYQNYSFLDVEIKKELQLFLPTEKSQLPTDLLLGYENETIEKSQSTTDELESTSEYTLNLLLKVSFTHFVELLKIDDVTKRRFYELMIIKSTLSVKDLKQQINSLAYERVGMSQDLEKASDTLSKKLNPEQPAHAVKDLYFFDFLEIPHHTLVEESELESSLIKHLQSFILELGNGFCFEARQKRMLIDDTYFFADLIFYHRILKCHVIVELKVDQFKHEYLSQLNTYVAYYNEQIKEENDNPAIGILMCTDKGEKLVEYAKAGIDNQLFVSKYLLQLPEKKELERFIKQELFKSQKNK